MRTNYRVRLILDNFRNKSFLCLLCNFIPDKGAKLQLGPKLAKNAIDLLGRKQNSHTCNEILGQRTVGCEISQIAIEVPGLLH